ncbi:MAG TPA: glycosyltransferase family 4 protein [Bacteroidia bacterium]|nr:glycosyltransferase family 4 protein [Bacteroidia bacterium]
MTDQRPSKKVLIITYYWPPSGGAGVQRWLKFVKYLRDFGWEPVVYTPSNPENPGEDESLLRDIPEGVEVIKTEIWEPYNLYRKFAGVRKTEKINPSFHSDKKKASISQSFSVWLRGNFFIPDPRKFWIKPSVQFLSEWIAKNPVDAIVSSGPPHSMHLIARGLHRKTGIPWLADFRDPWTNIDFYDDLKLSGWADRKHRRLEKSVLEEANTVLSVGKTMNEEFVEMMKKNNSSADTSKFKVIANGYDESDVFKGEVKPDSKFSIAHIGTMSHARNPEVLWKVLKRLSDTNPVFKNELEIKLVGKVDGSVVESVRSFGLGDTLNLVPYLPHHDVMKVQQQSRLLLLVLNNTRTAKGILTGKFFEYMSAKRPVLAVGPVDGDAAEILRETNAGTIAGYADEELLYGQVSEAYGKFKEGKLEVNSAGIEKYSRRALTGELADVLDSLVK